MRIGYFTDPHIRVDTPEGRTDDYRVAIYDKLVEIGNIFNSKGVTQVLTGGDIFDHPDVAQSLIYDVMGILKAWNLPIISTIGSHDYFGYQMKTLKRTAVGILRQSDILEILDNDESELKHENGTQYLPSHIRLTDVDSTIVEVVATPHTYWLSENPQNYYKSKSPDVDFQIQLTHGDLQHKNVPWPHVKISEVTTDSDLVLGAHYHPGWPEVARMINNKKTWFINPGAIARLENSGARRVPKVVILDITKEKFSFEYVELQSAALHPFKNKETEENKPVIQDIGKLMGLIENTKVTAIDIKVQLPKIAKELNYSKEVLNKAFDYLDSVK